MFQKKMYEKKGEKKTRVSDVVSSLAWKCHEFVAQDIRFFLGAFCLVFFPLFLSYFSTTSFRLHPHCF